MDSRPDRARRSVEREEPDEKNLLGSLQGS